MHLGKGVKTERAQATLQKAGDLVLGEEVLAYVKCNNLRPMVDRVVVTNARVLGMSDSQHKYKYKAPVSKIARVDCDGKKGTVCVVTSDGQEMTFKSIAADDVTAVERHVEHARSVSAPPEVLEAIAALGIEGSSVLDVDGATREDVRAAKNARKGQEKAARKAAEEEAAKLAEEGHAARVAEFNRIAGSLVVSKSFGMKAVSIYQNGYVRVGGMFRSSKPPLERLLAIEASSDVSKKTGPGRAVGAVFTGGVDLAFTNKRGDVYLTIVTDRTTHALHVEAPNAWDLKASKRLEAAGNAVIQTGAATAPVAAGRPIKGLLPDEGVAAVRWLRGASVTG